MWQAANHVSSLGWRRIGQDKLPCLGITAPEDLLKVRPDIMMVGLMTDDPSEKKSRATKKHYLRTSMASPATQISLPDFLRGGK